MNGVKRFFGVLLLGVAAWMLLPVAQRWFGQDAAPAQSASADPAQMDRAPATALPWRSGADADDDAAMSRAPDASPYSGATVTTVRSVAELDALVAASNQPVMLDFYADWCVSCKEMEKLTFPEPEVAQRMARVRVVRADVTANNADDQALLKRFKLFGPPGIVFFAPGGRQLPTRVIGFQNAGRFAGTLDTVLASVQH
jgi:thiol:disulfide interchange protein DsbD